ncbi:MAG: hypothetical protein V7742_11355 [Halioglobus sp.]
MKRLLIGAAFAAIAQGSFAAEVLFCNDEKVAGLFPKPGGIEVKLAIPTRFKLALDGMSVKVAGDTLFSEGVYECESPWDLNPQMLDCRSPVAFSGFSYNTKTKYGIGYFNFPDDELPVGGDTPVVSIFKCDAF